MPSGGKRRGAGRPFGTGKFQEPTTPIRCPVSMLDQVRQLIKKLYDDRQQNVAFGKETDYGKTKEENNND